LSADEFSDAAIGHPIIAINTISFSPISAQPGSESPASYVFNTCPDSFDGIKVAGNKEQQP
jgi:hypothetical protein